MSTHDTSPKSDRVFFSKQPILDAERRIWGYELLSGEIQDGLFMLFDTEESAAASLRSSTFFGLKTAMDRGKRVMVALNAQGLRDGLARTLPPELGIIRLILEEPASEGFKSIVQGMRDEGYTIALEVNPDALDKADHDLADIVALDFTPRPMLGIKVRKVTGNAQLLARGIETIEQFEEARAQKFTLFQGPFFKLPELEEGRELASNEISRMEMLRIIETEGPDPEGIAEAVKGDVSISFRLLTLLNSPAFGLVQKVDSVDHAVNLLGWEKLRNWLRAVLLADMAGAGEGPQELAAISMQRAKFLELVTMEYDYWGFNPETMFLLGLFSLLDSILGMPMAEVVNLLPMDAKLKASLMREEGNDHQPLLDLIDSLEDGDWDRLDEMLNRLSFDQQAVKAAYAAATAWAGVFLSVEEWNKA